MILFFLMVLFAAAYAFIYAAHCLIRKNMAGGIAMLMNALLPIAMTAVLYCYFFL